VKLRLTFRIRGPGAWGRRGRLIFLLIFAVAISLGARTLFGEKGLLEWWRLRDEAIRLEHEVEALQATLRAERQAVRDLRDGGPGVERIARERLGMIRPGEVVYLLPPASGGETAGEDGLLDSPGDE
jgi:cell division protein FtsB